MKHFIAILLVLGAQAVLMAENAPEFAAARAQRLSFRDELMRKILADPQSDDLIYALAAFYTGKDQAGGNRKLLAFLDTTAGPKKVLTAETAATENVKWRMRTLLRIYFLFGNKSTHFPGRLTPEAQQKLEDLFFHYGCGKSTVRRAGLDSIWRIQGSENHDMMDLSNAYLALQAVQDLEPYKNQKLPDGHTPAEHVKAWDAYYARYALERARNGLFVEISPTYGKWFVGELVNMYEFSASPLVRKRMEMLLHLTWADWSIDQLNGVRGGGKTRCYQGHYSQLEFSDSWDRMARALLGMENWIATNSGIQTQMILSISSYQPPDIVMDLALNPRQDEPFVYRSVRPAKVVEPPGDTDGKPSYWMDGTGGRALRYSYCTPAYVMGSWMLDTRLNYAAIHSQNRWQGVIFSADRRLRVFPQSVGLNNGKTYNQHQAAQQRNVMLVTRDPRAKQAGPLRVFFSNDLRKSMVEKKGWVIVQAGSAWLGVRVMGSSPQGDDRNYQFKQGPRDDQDDSKYGYWLWPAENDAPVALVGSMVSRHPRLEDFLTYLAEHHYTLDKGRVSYTCKDDTGSLVRLELGGNLPHPVIDGLPVNLQPENVFDSPFLTSVHGSGVVKLQHGERRLVLDFNAPVPDNN